ncbi:GNAT family N-acetyltransferase [Litorihabitans aurantiacus]|uniref:N-acetyltransferase n=1 Tax=Litorihabitans aurantiacus TaxID=1930061 RepID=A0AA38CTS3_9MICO|nr:GNAT family N-acetyltransferase [Litorihabitans aurantiacus]GMA33011.1 N-acetyltransferase [Litorihabitans aurantiacus]
MTTTLATPTASQLPAVVATLATWQRDGLPVQLHPGDLGWAWQLGADALAARVRTWHDGAGLLAAVGFLDGDTVLRLGLDPDRSDDEELADAVAHDLVDPGRGVLPDGEAAVEARLGAALHAWLVAHGWVDDEPWTPLVLDLATAPEVPASIAVEVVDGGDRDAVDLAVATHASGFERSRFTRERWGAMAAGPAFAGARCLLARAVSGPRAGDAVATTIVWSAGPGRPGLIEPLSVSRDHRGHGYGRALTVAAASHLRAMGASGVSVATPSDNAGAVATYRSAGMRELASVRDLRRQTT